MMTVETAQVLKYDNTKTYFSRCLLEIKAQQLWCTMACLIGALHRNNLMYSGTLSGARWAPSWDLWWCTLGRKLERKVVYIGDRGGAHWGPGWCTNQVVHIGDRGGARTKWCTVGTGVVHKPSGAHWGPRWCTNQVVHSGDRGGAQTKWNTLGTGEVRIGGLSNTPNPIYTTPPNIHHPQYAPPNPPNPIFTTPSVHPPPVCTTPPQCSPTLSVHQPHSQCAPTPLPVRTHPQCAPTPLPMCTPCSGATRPSVHQML